MSPQQCPSRVRKWWRFSAPCAPPVFRVFSFCTPTAFYGIRSCCLATLTALALFNSPLNEGHSKRRPPCCFRKSFILHAINCIVTTIDELVPIKELTKTSKKQQNKERKIIENPPRAISRRWKEICDNQKGCEINDHGASHNPTVQKYRILELEIGEFRLLKKY